MAAGGGSVKGRLDSLDRENLSSRLHPYPLGRTRDAGVLKSVWEEANMRLAWVALVVVLGLGWMGAAAAQEAPSPPPMGDVAPQAPAPKPVLQSLVDFGSFGVNVGLMRYLADKESSTDVRIRPSLQGVFRYRFNDRWVGVSEWGYGWNAYKDKGDTVMTVVSGTFGAYRHISQALNLDWKLGGGFGFYRTNYKFHGKSIRDPKTELYYRSIDPGLFVGGEAEKRLSPHVTLLGTLQFHYLFSSNKDDFPTAFSGNDAYTSLRFGVNYHFSPYEGILWEKKTKRTIRLTSGKAGS
jgi:hypothetical protein